MEGDWSVVSQRKKVAKPKPVEKQVQYGGKVGDKLIAGPIRKANQPVQAAPVVNQASAIANFDYFDMVDETKFEKVSHVCAQGVRQARVNAGVTQEKLAQMIGEKASMITDIENGDAQYKAGVINSIEKALKAKIERGRGKKK